MCIDVMTHTHVHKPIWRERFALSRTIGYRGLCARHTDRGWFSYGGAKHQTNIKPSFWKGVNYADVAFIVPHGIGLNRSYIGLDSSRSLKIM